MWLLNSHSASQHPCSCAFIISLSLRYWLFNHRIYVFFVRICFLKRHSQQFATTKYLIYSSCDIMWMKCVCHLILALFHLCLLPMFISSVEEWTSTLLIRLAVCRLKWFLGDTATVFTQYESLMPLEGGTNTVQAYS